MAEPATQASPALPRALAEPAQPVSRRWIVALGITSLGIWMADLTPLQVQLPEQLQAISPHYKFLAVGLIHAFGALACILVTPLVGALSDRTTTAWPLGRLNGRRHRWTLGMVVLAAITMALLPAQHTIFGVVALWFLFSAFQNGQYASLSAAIPDHVPVSQRATVSGWTGMPYAAGLVLGTLLVVKFFTSLTSGYLVLAGCMLVFTLPFVFFTPDYPLERAHRQPMSARVLVGLYWVDLRRYPDFGWAWITRFLSTMSVSMGTLYLLFFLRDAVRYPHPTSGLLTLIMIYTGCVVVTAVAGGIISDRTGRRRLIVAISGSLMGIAALLLVFVETWTSARIAAVLFGAGFGTYLAVDQALITQVLPAAAHRAKDLGLINIAISGPAAIGGLLAAVLVTTGSYPTLFLATAISALTGALLVYRIKSVR